MQSESLCVPAHLNTWLTGHGFRQINHIETGCTFHREDDDTCLIIDTVICNLSHYPYVSYTSRQNELMADHAQIFRFLFDHDTSVDTLQQDIKIFLDKDSDPEQVRRFGGNRAEQEPDPTLPEATFEDCFLEAFGDNARMALHREFAYVDLEGVTRYIDYALFAEAIKFAIELNGEQFHHPVAIGPKRYRSQLFKQNSLVSDGFKVLRWSLNGMNDRERFILELSRFMGFARPFRDKSVVKVSRPVETFTLKLSEEFNLRDHQLIALDQIGDARRNGKSTFLLVLPTGTGKTEIFIEDIIRLKKDTPQLKALIIVPTRKLREQTLARLKLRLPQQYQGGCSEKIMDNDSADFYVQTSAYLHRHYYKIPADYFDYIVVDEAHHAVASGLRNILEHFIPNHLLGVTATPERFDQQPLEDLFGEYESQLSLKDAIREGLVPPVRCFRVKSNIDLTEVRFNGKEYVKNDLQSTLLIPSRDQLIADLLAKYFSGEFSDKQGVIFCVDIKHANRMAALLRSEGISAVAVNGKKRKTALKAQKDYDKGDVRFLCACDLLTEGWDAPQTSLLIMARPTFSKVLYTQQLGRGLRNHPGKEALYVIDVVDNYGAKLQPMSLHSLFKIPNYQPFANLINPDQQGSIAEITILDGLYEEERRIEPIDIFSFEEMYGTFLNEEQLARELFVSTGTIKQWIKKEKIVSDVQYPFGKIKLHFFDPAQVAEIRTSLNLQEHTEETRTADFHEFLKKRDYTFSYKIIFLLAFMKICNERSEAYLPDLLELYQMFYRNLLNRTGKNERDTCPLNSQESIDDIKRVQRSLLANPFEKFERKRFFYHCKDLNYIAMDPVLVKSLTKEESKEICQQMKDDLINYYDKQDITLIDEDYLFLFSEKPQEEALVLFNDTPTESAKYSSVLPFYPLSIAAGDFMDSEIPLEPETWFKVDGLSSRNVFSQSMFVAQVQGKSMEPDIPNGSYCLFTFEVGGTRNGQIVLAQHQDPETGAGYTLKKYRSTKSVDVDTGWRHENISLMPINPEYQEIVVPVEEADEFRIVAFFVEVLSADL
ncbi:MAG TPA: DEAD/DEAH box helicase [Deltaproteobacteria bacterium]|nr:DEAD/DEAH box helicase [Deltaproteobacteria bacterium]